MRTEPVAESVAAVLESDQHGILVSVNIPVHNDTRVLDCIAALETQDFPRECFEIVVVENGSETLSSLGEKEGITYVWQAGKSIPAARNAALRASRGKYIITLDADTIPDKGLISAMYRIMETNPSIGALGGRVERVQGDAGVLDQYGVLLAAGQSEVQSFSFCPLGYVITANACFRRQQLMALGGFDEQFLSGSDVDICWRLSIEGYEIRTSSEPLVVHRSRTSFSGYFRQYRRYAEYQCLLAKKYAQYCRPVGIRRNYYVVGAGQTVLSLCKALLRMDRAGLFRAYYAVVSLVAGLSGSIRGSIKYRVWHIK